MYVTITIPLEVALNSLLRGTSILENMLFSSCSEEVRRRRQEVPLNHRKLHDVPSQNSVICEHKNVCCEQRILIISEYGGSKYTHFYTVVAHKNVCRSVDCNLYRTGVETSNWVH